MMYFKIIKYFIKIGAEIVSVSSKPGKGKEK